MFPLRHGSQKIFFHFTKYWFFQDVVALYGFYDFSECIFDISRDYILRHMKFILWWHCQSQKKVTWDVFGRWCNHWKIDWSIIVKDCEWQLWMQRFGKGGMVINRYCWDKRQKIMAVKHRNVGGRFLPRWIGLGRKVFVFAVGYEKSVQVKKRQ